MRTKVAVIGSGNIGTDLLIKMLRLSKSLEVVAMVGIDPASDGLARAARLGVATTAEGVDGLIRLAGFADIDIVFDATSARAHIANNAKLAAYGRTMIDLTPAAIGPYVVPAVNLDQHLSELPADLIVCATGFRQGVPFFDENVQQGLFDERGNFLLYRQILPLGVDGLYFNGYNSSFFSPLNAEMAAVWITAHLAGAVSLPDPDAMRRQTVAQLAFMDVATDRHHCRGTKIIPFSLKNLDEVLDDLDLNISKRVRASHWLNPVDPSAYRAVTPTLIARLRLQDGVLEAEN